jgi:hypothetical protein
MRCGDTGWFVWTVATMPAFGETAPRDGEARALSAGGVGSDPGVGVGFRRSGRGRHPAACGATRAVAGRARGRGSALRRGTWAPRAVPSPGKPARATASPLAAGPRPRPAAVSWYQPSRPPPDSSLNTIPAASRCRRRFVSRVSVISPRVRTRSVNRRSPSNRSRTSNNDHRSPITSKARAIMQKCRQMRSGCIG